MSETIEISVIVLISIIINYLTYSYLYDKHKNDKKTKNEFTKKKSIYTYAFSSLAFALVVVGCYFLNSSALTLGFTSITLIYIVVFLSYLISTIFAFVHSNMTVEYIKYLIRNGEKEKRILVLIVHTILTLGITYASINAFVLLLDNTFMYIARLIMLSSFLLSFTIVIIYKELKGHLKEK